MVGSPAIGPEPPGAVLSGRGFKIEDKGKLRDILLPLDGTKALAGGTVNEFRRLFAHSAFLCGDSSRAALDLWFAFGRRSRACQSVDTGNRRWRVRFESRKAKRRLRDDLKSSLVRRSSSLRRRAFASDFPFLAAFLRA